MKINFIVPGLYFKSGGLRIIFEYANRLYDKGHNVKVYSPLIYYNLYKGNFKLRNTLSIYKNSLRNIALGAKIPDNFYIHKFEIKYVPLINNYFVDDADVVVATSWPTSFSVNKLSISKGKKVYFIQDYETWNSNIDKVNESYKLPLKRITISMHLKNLLEEKFKVDSIVIYNGIDFTKFRNDNKIFNKSCNISFIYNTLAKKNTKLAIDTAIKVKNKYNDTKFICFGYSDNPKIPDFIEYHKNPGDEQIKKIYCNSDIFMFTSSEEGFGLPPAEAMACKCAVVSTNVGAIQEYSTNNKSAIHIDPKDSDGYYTSVLNLIDDRSKLKSISEEGYKSVKSILNWENSVKQFECFLRKIIS